MGAISNKPRKNRRDADLRDAVSLLKSAREKRYPNRFMPNDPELQNSMGDLLVSWAQDGDSKDIDDFFSEKEIGPMKFYSACEDNPYLNECLEIALSIISVRIRKEVQDSFEYKMKMIPHYNSLMRKERRDKIDADKQRKEDTKFEVIVNRG